MTTTMGVRGRIGQARSWTPRGIGDREVEIALGGAMVASAALALWVGRRITFSADELSFFIQSQDLTLHRLFQPHNGHLILIPRLVYAGILNALGPEYLPFRMLAIGTVLLTAGLFFVYAKRRIGALAALAPTLLLLFYGSDSEHSIAGNGFPVLLPVALGIGALLSLEREDRRGDVAASLLLCLAIATYSVGLAFLAGATVLILIGEDRWRRAWVFAVPAVLYAAWLLWSRNAGGSTTESNLTLSNLLLAPNWAANSLATIGSALLGLKYPRFGTGWGPVIAIIAAAALVWRLSQGGVSKWLWAAIAVPATLWVISVAVAAHWRLPSESRYLFPGTVAVLLVAVEAARGWWLERRGLLILYGLVAIGLGTNLILLRDGGAQLRAAATAERADLAAIEVTGGRVGPRLPAGQTRGILGAPTGRELVAHPYMDAVRQFGSPAFSLLGLASQTESARDRVDADVADSLGIHLQPASGPFSGCRRVTTTPGEATALKLPPGGAVLRTSGTPAPLTLRRFGTAFTVQAGTLQPGVPAALPIPSDSAPDPWYASTTTGPLTVCGPPSA